MVPVKITHFININIFLYIEKLEINEVITMFKVNKIPIKIKEIYELFRLMDEEKKKKNCHEFKNLANFTISNSSDQEFRNFMRKVKKRLDRRNSVEKTSQKASYIPMSFNGILEYFNIKGKIRNSINNINGSMVRNIYLFIYFKLKGKNGNISRKK
jgi:hypothetical protein